METIRSEKLRLTSVEMQNKNKGTEKIMSNKNNVPKVTEIDKTDRTICPVCGLELTKDGWCCTKNCPVIDDSDNYR